MSRLAALALCAAALLGGCGPGVGEGRLRQAAEEPADWLTNGRTYSEQRYSPLAQITARNVVRLGLAWKAPLESNDFGVKAGFSFFTR